MAGGTLFFTFGYSVYVLLLARILQGLAGAAVGVVGFALLADTVDNSELGQAMGHVSAATTWGLLLGTTIGGIVSGELHRLRTDCADRISSSGTSTLDITPYLPFQPAFRSLTLR